MTPQTPASIVEKLQKLLAMQVSARSIGSIAEAAAFGAKIQALLSQHKLTLSDLDAKKEEAEGATLGNRIHPWSWGMKVNAGSRLIPWIGHLARTIARCNDCEALVIPDIARTIKGKPKRNRKGETYTVLTDTWVFVGVESDRLQVEALFTYMSKLAWEMALNASDDYREQFRTEIIRQYGECVPVRLSKRQHHFRQSFCTGFSTAVCERLNEQRESMKQKAIETSNETALVLVDRRLTLIQNWMTVHARPAATEGVKSGYQQAANDALGMALGTIAGQSVALTHKTIGEESA